MKKTIKIEKAVVVETQTIEMDIEFPVYFYYENDDSRETLIETWKRWDDGWEIVIERRQTHIGAEAWRIEKNWRGIVLNKALKFHSEDSMNYALGLNPYSSNAEEFAAALGKARAFIDECGGVA